MGQRLIEENAAVDRATYRLPNKHYIPVEMKYIGIDNTSPFQSLLLFSEDAKCTNVINVIQGPRGSVRAGFDPKVRAEDKKEGEDEMSDITHPCPDLSSGLISATVARVGDA